MKNLDFALALRLSAKIQSMYTRLDRAHRAIPVILGIITLISAAMLLALDIYPKLLSASAHVFLGAFPLAMIAIAYLLYQSAHRPPLREWVKAVMLAVAFLFWSANQFWSNPQQAMVFNDIAIALFVLDVFLVMIGWPASSADESFAETYSEPRSRISRSDPPDQQKL